VEKVIQRKKKTEKEKEREVRHSIPICKIVVSLCCRQM